MRSDAEPPVADPRVSVRTPRVISPRLVARETGIDGVRHGKADPATHWIQEPALPPKRTTRDSVRNLDLGANNDDILEPVDAAPNIATIRQIGIDGFLTNPVPAR